MDKKMCKYCGGPTGLGLSVCSACVNKELPFVDPAQIEDAKRQVRNAEQRLQVERDKSVSPRTPLTAVNLKAEPPPAFLNEDQQAIWKKFEELKLLAIRKNTDYGSSVFKRPVLCPMDPPRAILVRMSDKINRMQNLYDNASLIKSESFCDTMGDLATYGILWLIADDRERQPKKGD